MKEIGIDIFIHRSKSVEEFIGQPLAFVVTFRNSANETCPVFPSNVKRLHWPFDDPAAVEGADEVRRAASLGSDSRAHHGFLEGNGCVR